MCCRTSQKKELICVASMGGVAPLDTNFLEKMIAKILQNGLRWKSME